MVFEYQQWTLNTAKYPKAGTGDNEELYYLALGLVGEAGEIANKVKKVYRDGKRDNDDLAKELGDVMWYAARFASAIGFHLDTVMADNRDKLESRLKRDAIGGSGDNR
jgi:NTP pyrophosphatase (non-canonical NTP hydrolase)